ncbi:MAG: DUF72 domain-containing protein [Actinobacteria bacterium]|nr:DUF72 domain-containing protein [Actinomycetota bacterium]
MTVFIGTSGWQYKHWRETYYPKGLPQSRWLEHYVEDWQTVEVNNSFYRLPDASTFESWAARTPDDFVVAVKASRYLTHIRRLREPQEPVERFLDRARHLGSKLGPVLLQLPPNFRADVPLLAETLALFPPTVRVAVEARHDSWFTDELHDALAAAGAALCLADRHSRPVTPLWRTASWGFVRFHEGRATPHPCYGLAALQSWAGRVAGLWTPDEDVFVFFNNDGRACALRDAAVFSECVRAAGLRPTRVVHTRDVRVG